ncbi:MAG: hypothetical protein K5864_07385 [Bacteroidales bacterium]|nr:hypothetical protein [Bacteroidales bacterium]
MTNGKVSYYHKIGDYQSAYALARADWELCPSSVRATSTLAWEIIAVLKISTHVYSRDIFLERLQEFGSIGIADSNKRLWGAVVYPIRDMLADSLEMQWFTADLGDRLFAIIHNFPFEKPSDAYSMLLRSFMSVGGLWPQLAVFMEWWGLENFSSFDKRRYPVKGELISFEEQAMREYKKAKIMLEHSNTII